MNFDRQFSTVAALIAEGDTGLRTAAARLSSWDIGQHLDHLLRVCNGIFTVIRKGTPLDEPGINVPGRLLLFVGRLPRGRARAPESVLGTVRPSVELMELLDSAREKLSQIQIEEVARSKSRVFRHPYFGCLTASEALRFCEVHNDHHLRIIGDIKRAAGGTRDKV